MNLLAPREAPQWLLQSFRTIERAFREVMDAPFRLKSYTVAALPPAANWKAGLVYVPNEAGGAQPAFSDGVSWRRLTDRAIVS